MEKLDLKPTRSISLRRIRTHAEWKVETHMIRARLPTRSSTRSFISAAALLVKVIARIEPGWARRSEISHAIRRVSTRVLPDPAPATTSSGAPSCITAARCGSLSPSRSSSRLGPRRGGGSEGATDSRPGSGIDVLISDPAYVRPPPVAARRAEGSDGDDQREPGDAVARDVEVDVLAGGDLRCETEQVRRHRLG